MKVYLIGSLRNPKVPEAAAVIRAAGHEVFDDWYASGPEADDIWKRYEEARGRSYEDAMIQSTFAKNAFDMDVEHLDWCDAGVLMLPAGRSGHLELGYLCGKNKHTYILLDDQYDRWDMMYLFAGMVTRDLTDIVCDLDYLKEGDDQ